MNKCISTVLVVEVMKIRQSERPEGAKVYGRRDLPRRLMRSDLSTLILHALATQIGRPIMTLKGLDIKNLAAGLPEYPG